MVIASGTLQVEKGIVNLDSFVATNEKEFIKLEKWCEKKIRFNQTSDFEICASQ